MATCESYLSYVRLSVISCLLCSSLCLVSIWFSCIVKRDLSYSNLLHFSFIEKILSAARQKLPLDIPEPLDSAETIDC